MGRSKAFHGVAASCGEKKKRPRHVSGMRHRPRRGPLLPKKKHKRRRLEDLGSHEPETKKSGATASSFGEGAASCAGGGGGVVVVVAGRPRTRRSRAASMVVMVVVVVVLVVLLRGC
jgi:hypothetical protein